MLLWVFTWLLHINSMKVVPFIADVALQSFVAYALVLIIDTHYGLYSHSGML